MMNEWDRDNLDFIMNSDHEDFEAWLLQASDDDVEYALELIKKAKLEYMVKELELTDEVPNFNEAKVVIDKIRNMK